jgi:hypothetical protein
VFTPKALPDSATFDLQHVKPSQVRSTFHVINTPAPITRHESGGLANPNSDERLQLNVAVVGAPG